MTPGTHVAISAISAVVYFTAAFRYFGSFGKGRAWFSWDMLWLLLAIVSGLVTMLNLALIWHPYPTSFDFLEWPPEIHWPGVPGK